MEIFNNLNSFSQQISSTYHISPEIFVVIYVISIPLFYVCFYNLVRVLVHIIKEQGKITPKHFIYEERLTFWGATLALVYLSPYLYIAIFGKNIPYWIWTLVLAFVAISAYGIYKKVSKQSKK